MIKALPRTIVNFLKDPFKTWVSFKIDLASRSSLHKLFSKKMTFNQFNKKCHLLDKGIYEQTLIDRLKLESYTVKKYFNEIKPIQIFSKHYCLEKHYSVELPLNSAPYDAIISNNNEKIFIEVTSTYEGLEEKLITEKLKKYGKAPHFYSAKFHKQHKQKTLSPHTIAESANTIIERQKEFILGCIKKKAFNKMN